ncbi:hypothetical protein DR864_04010 [Runella rosea]|uniref:histidine kinase n=1 Tax=Runella rosea TaxID=2259595 RepID=A0A344TE83_9BACT|nr:7TM diverse intracellular signaling domain-containing protein [Runella rosea]AXE16954.1 hypothetical protein DR864_04010 [Runella rosea]
MRIFTVLFTLLLLTLKPSFSQQIILNPQQALTITKDFQLLPDSNKTLTIKDILKKEFSNSFSTATSTTTRGQNIDVYWLRFTVKNDTDLDQEWVFDFENWAYVDFYHREQARYYLKKTGHLYPQSKRDYPVANKNYIVLPLKSGQTTVCIVRLDYRLSISKIPKDLSFGVSPRKITDAQNALSGKTIFAFLGIFAIMFLYNLFIFIVTRLKSYAYYLLVLLSAFYFTSSNSGYLLSLFSSVDNFPVWASKFEYIGSALGNIAYFLFVQSLMSTKVRYPKQNKILNILVLLNAINCILFYIFFEAAFTLLLLVTIIGFVFILVLGIRCIKDKIPSAGYFLVGYLINMMGVICIILVLTGVLPKNEFTFEFSVPLGLLGEVMLFAFALANMINVLRKDNEEKQKKNIKQLLENQELQTKVNRELEQKVAERTDELNRSLNQLRITQDQLILKEKLASLGELTAGIAHEIQNPLNFVNNFSELSIDLAQELKEEIAKPTIDQGLVSDLIDDLTQNQQKIHHHGQRASGIVKGMLEHSRTGIGERQLTNLNGLANEYLQIAYQGMRAKDAAFEIELITDFDTNLPKTEIVPQELGRVLLNLYQNAFYATHEKKQQQHIDYQPTIWVSTQIVKNMIELRIKDNGTGIPKENITKIFQPFFTTKATGDGTGLGLSISYDIVTKGHSGELIVESEKGSYSEFIVRLPI